MLLPCLGLAPPQLAKKELLRFLSSLRSGLVDVLCVALASVDVGAL